MNELNQLIKNSKYKLSVFYYELNVSRCTFYNIRKGKRPLRENEIDKLSRLLNIPKEQIKEMIKEQ